MKRIAVFCDGTWSSADQPNATNVRQMALMIPPRGTDGVEQMVLYYNGVGVPEGGGWLEAANERIGGGAFGWGLDARIAQAFQQICENYRPGDQLYVFGFSRGAYTARSLVGLIRNVGLPAEPSPADLDACFRHYRDRRPETHPDAGESLEFRLRRSPEVCTSPEDAAWREHLGAPVGERLSVAYLGVWDTVGALGIPSHWGPVAGIFNGKYRFHDTDLTSMVAAARHAVAIDERRRSFVPTLWSNLARRRVENPAGEYRQEWFAGNHGSVGGGGDILVLSSIALHWIAEGAIAAGLHYDELKLAAVRRQRNVVGALFHRTAPPGLVDRAMAVTSAWRKGPAEIGDVSWSAIRRFRTDPLPPTWDGKPYRPPPLARLGDALGRVDLETLPD